MTQFEIDSFATASGGGGGVVSGAYQLSGIYQVSGGYAFDFAKQVSGLYVTFSGGMYAPSGAAGGSIVSGSLQLSGLYVTHSGGLYQASGIFQSSGVFLNSGAFQVSGIYPTSGLFSLSGTGGAAGGVSGVIHGSIFTGSGNSSTVLYTLSHGIGSVPSTIVVAAGSPLARSTVDVSGNASGIFVTYPIAPSSGTVRLHWMAGPSNIAIIGSVGSGSVHAGTFLGSGNGSTTLYTLSHGLGVAPQGISVEPASPHARGVVDVSGDASGIYVTFPVAPASGDVRLTWIAGPSTIATLASGAWQTSGVYQASGAFQLSGVFALSGVAGGLSGYVHAGDFIGSGNASTTVYTLSHGLGIAPVGISVEAESQQARGDFDVSGNASGIFVTYPIAPGSGTVRLSWIAGPSSAATIVQPVLGSGITHLGTFLGSGNNSTTLYTVSHGLAAVPQGISVEPASPQARGVVDVSGNASGIYVTYTSPPASGDVRLSWIAGPSNLAVLASGAWQTSGVYDISGGGTSGIQTITSGSQITGVISGSPTFPGTVSFSGTTNISQHLPRPFPYYTVFRSGDVYISQKYDGTTLTALSGVPGSVIQSTLNAVSGAINSDVGRTEIYVTDGHYPLESGFNGFDMTEQSTLTLGLRAIFDIPLLTGGYSGYFIKFGEGITRGIVRGGYVREGATAADLSGKSSSQMLQWTAIRFEAATTAANLDNRLEDMHIMRAGKGVQIRGHTSGWINANSVHNVHMYHCRNFFDFDVSGWTFNGGNNGPGNTNSNSFDDIWCQSNGYTEVGVRGINGEKNEFRNVVIWDTSIGASGDGCVNTTIQSGAADTLIIGGRMTNRATVGAGTYSGQLLYQDYGSGTKIFDSFSNIDSNRLTAREKLYLPNDAEIDTSGGSTFWIRNDASGQEPNVQLIPGSGASSTNFSMWSRKDIISRLRIITANTGITYRAQRNLTAGAVPPHIFQALDSVATTTIEAMRVTSSGNVEFNRSGGKPQFFSGNTSAAASGTAANSGAYVPAGYMTMLLGTRSIRVPFFD